MGNALGSWLSGPQAAGAGGEVGEYRGQLLGLPQTGRGSMPGSWHRVITLLVDWLMCYAIAAVLAGAGLLGGQQWLGTTVIGVWALVGWLTVSLFSFTPGQFVTGLCVVPVIDGQAAPGRRVNPIAAFFRVLLIIFIVPPLMNDNEGRGLHDRATQTVVVRSR